jgi:indolepyruvate decarboxylase
MSTVTRIDQYLIAQLQAHGVGHVFGVPGDFVLQFMDTLTKSSLRLVNTCDEQGAGFAADAYARVRGLGAVCVTYGVGGLKLCNTAAEAFAERSPVIVISGAPGVAERARHPLIHHKVRDFDTQKKVFEQLTVASAVLDDADTALGEIDRVFAAALRYKRPVYLELPRDMLAVRTRHHHVSSAAPQVSDAATLSAALAEAVALFNAAEQPVLLVGEEVHRFSLQQAVLDLVEHANVPVAATILGKSVIDEDHPAYMGIYQGGMGREEVRAYVESSDCVVMLGMMMTDVNLGVFTARLDRTRCINAVSEKLSIGHHVYEDVLFADFVHGLASAELRPRELAGHPASQPAPAYEIGDPRCRITVERLFQRLDRFLSEDTCVIADPGDALFGAANLTVHQSTAFLSPAYYASLGFAVPAALGVQLAAPHLRPLVLVGDGAFQMTGLELSTVARYGLNPIVMVLNNGGYVTERYILDGTFNDILPWRYHRLPQVLGAGRGFVVETEGELDAALAAVEGYVEGFSLIEVMLDKMDASPGLKRLAAGLAAAR